MDVIGSREIAAGVEPAHLEGESRNAHRKSLAHDVSILPGVGRHLGSQPRANTKEEVYEVYIAPGSFASETMEPVAC
jgi:hypothetical protein